ncbi:MAG: cellulase family glycosylhydrolase [Candidatus Omnitrophica bacterium]|nr:cellulase family glycosylhydrolase [Candidatus Omnitrophota bacterium]
MFKISRKLYIVCFILVVACSLLPVLGRVTAQDSELEFTLDANSPTVVLPKVFSPNMDLSGRGFSRDGVWPQSLAAKEVIERWQKEIGFSGFYRLQYSLWEISQLDKNKDEQKKLLANYDDLIKKISDAGGVVIVNIFGTPVGSGAVLDKRSPPQDLSVFKQALKNTIRELSCNKKYNVWYEIWNAPDLDDFFLGKAQEYLNLYRAAAQVIKELEQESKIQIPIGGPSTSWWFQNMDGNTIVNPERSLVYELIKYCYRYRLPLDFISWHAYSTDPRADKALTIYKKDAVTLIRDWLSYFKFERNTPLIIDEWNFDRNVNVSEERKDKANICASFIPARLKGMFEQGIDNQVYFCLEDFQANKDNVTRNTGVFSFDQEYKEYRGSAKSIYNAFRMLSCLGKELYTAKLNDDFIGIIATKGTDSFVILAYNYIDPDIAINFLSRNIGILTAGEKKFIIKSVHSDMLMNILSGKQVIAGLRTTKRVKELMSKAKEKYLDARKFDSGFRNLKLGIKNLKDNYLYERYVIDSSCHADCDFSVMETKEIQGNLLYEEALSLSPYSVQMIILKKKIPLPEDAKQ